MNDEINDFLLTEKSIENGKEYEKNMKWLDECSGEKRRKHSGKIVIVLDQEIWGTAETPSEVHDKLENLPRGRQLQAYIEFFSEEGERLH